MGRVRPRSPMRSPWNHLVFLFLAMALVAPLRAAAADGEVVGVVVSENGIRLEGAQVTIEGIGTMETDAAGQFFFPKVGQGNYRITAAHPGFPAYSRTLFVRAGIANKVQITLQGTAPPPANPRLVVVPITRQGNAILVQTVINGAAPTTLLVDTGATYGLISPQLAEVLRIAPDHTARRVRIMTVSGTVEAPLIRLDSVRVGEAEARNVEVLVHGVPGWPPWMGGLLGLSFLNRFRVSIDTEAGQMILAQ